MIGWTIQTQEAWQVAQEKGCLMGCEAFVDDDFLLPYQWLMNQMKIRVANYDGTYPIWLYDKKPDLRYRFANRGTDLVLLKVELAPDSYLVSDYMTWHYVLTDTTFTKDDDDQEVIDKEKSWERIFDFEFLTEWNEGETKYIVPQITTGAIPLNKIQFIRTFKSK